MVADAVVPSDEGDYALILVVNFNSYPPGQNGRHFTDDISRSIFVNEMFFFFY